MLILDKAKILKNTNPSTIAVFVPPVEYFVLMLLFSWVRSPDKRASTSTLGTASIRNSVAGRVNYRYFVTNRGQPPWGQATFLAVRGQTNLLQLVAKPPCFSWEPNHLASVRGPTTLWQLKANHLEAGRTKPPCGNWGPPTIWPLGASNIVAVWCQPPPNYPCIRFHFLPFLLQWTMPESCP